MLNSQKAKLDIINKALKKVCNGGGNRNNVR